MKLELFVLCDAATVSGGKLNILGAFDTIHSNHFPALHPQCALALRMRFSRMEEGLHKIRLTLVDADGRSVEGAILWELGPAMPNARPHVAWLGGCVVTQRVSIRLL